MPGVFRVSVDQLEKEARDCMALGINSVILFGLPEKKDAMGSGAHKKDGIIQTGIIHPPFLLQHPDRPLEVITGHKRLTIADKYLGSDKIACFVLPENFPQKEIPDLLLTDQSETPLSPAEKARFIQIASRCMAKEEILRKFSKRLEIREHTSAIDQMEKLLAMDTEIIKEIHSGRLQHKMIGELLRIKVPEDRLALVSLFRDLSLGGGKQKKLFSLVDGNEIGVHLEESCMMTPRKSYACLIPIGPQEENVSYACNEGQKDWITLDSLCPTKS